MDSASIDDTIVGRALSHLVRDFDTNEISRREFLCYVSPPQRLINVVEQNQQNKLEDWVTDSPLREETIAYLHYVRRMRAVTRGAASFPTGPGVEQRISSALLGEWLSTPAFVQEVDRLEQGLTQVLYWSNIAFFASLLRRGMLVDVERPRANVWRFPVDAYSEEKMIPYTRARQRALAVTHASWQNAAVLFHNECEVATESLKRLTSLSILFVLFPEQRSALAAKRRGEPLNLSCFGEQDARRAFMRPHGSPLLEVLRSGIFLANDLVVF